MSGLTRRVVAVVVIAAAASGCMLWSPERSRPVVRSNFPPLDAVADGPLIWAEAHPDWGAVPLVVYFSVELLEEAAFEAWAWDFGDGTPFVRRRQPQHTYRHPGVYEVRVWARDRRGRISMDTVKVRVDSETPD